MKFMCPHCGGSEFRLLNGADSKPAAQCLNCGRASTFEQSMLPGAAETAEQPASEN
jgi:transcription elongation factor Elf1